MLPPRDRPAWPSSKPFGRPSLRLWVLVALLSMIGASGAGFVVATRRAAAGAQQGSWPARVGRVARAANDGRVPGILAVSGSGEETWLGEGALVPSGWRLRTDAKTRARVDFEDGSNVVLERTTELRISADGVRGLELFDGVMLANFAASSDLRGVWLRTPSSRMKTEDSKLAATVTPGKTSVEVLRGEVALERERERPLVVRAGMEVVTAAGALPELAFAHDLAQRVSFSESVTSGGAHNEDADESAGGIGQLLARRPGKSEEKDRALRLARHDVRVRIAGNFARTEVEETFANDTDEELEGVFRFPLPPTASIESLALDVDGKLVRGEFVDRSKAAAIWRGVIRHAAPSAPKPVEEIIWVPGPWRDPALLEWSRAGRFELRIFPIPKRSSRRVVIAYTETVAPSADLRRYIYPLPHSSGLKIADFSVDLQVSGHDETRGVHVRGYELTEAKVGTTSRLSDAIRDFTPTGDLVVEYALAGPRSDVSAWAYAPPSEPGRPPGSEDAYVALALRPKLPPWAEPRPRDQVVVIDRGRSMFGERLQRAKRLAVELVQEMDRRDRVTLLACDVRCDEIPGGFRSPGAAAAHDVDAFLARIRADGASDVVESVATATRAAGRDSARDLRVILLSDGAASAGYRTAARLEAEVRAALGSDRASLVAVPVGSDADVRVLEGVARGGGGVVVPYPPGQRLKRSALEVLNASYGTILRDVEIELPGGLTEMTPSRVGPIAAGAERIITARAKAQVEGDVVVRGRLAGEPFETRVPLRIEPSSAPGNAFVPRLFAAARIAERENEADGGTQAELVALSRRFSVPSRFTSLLVLESEAMFRAFGIERAQQASLWTGEALAEGTSGRAASDKDEGAEHGVDVDPLARDDAEEKSGFDGLATSNSRTKGESLGFGQSAGGRVSPSPAPMQPLESRAEAESAPARPGSLSRFPPFAEPPPAKRRRPSWNDAPITLRPFKRVWIREAEVRHTSDGAVSGRALALARNAQVAQPDHRDKTRELANLLAQAGELDELEPLLASWSERDPLDPDLLAARADLLGRRGKRDEALRVLDGIASAIGNVNRLETASSLARIHERAGEPTACAFRIQAAELEPRNAEGVARAIACEADRGHTDAAARWSRGFTDKRALDAALAKVGGRKESRSRGSLEVEATWEAGAADLDVFVVEPSANRASWLARSSSVRVDDTRSRARESLSMNATRSGSYSIEVVRGEGGDSLPIRGSLTIRAGSARGATTIPFTLIGGRLVLARVDVRYKPTLVPLDGPTPSGTPWRPDVWR